MAMDHVSTNIGNYHHGFPKAKESFSEKEKIYSGRPHAGGPHNSVGNHERSVRGETEGRYDNYDNADKPRGHDIPYEHARYVKDAYTESRHGQKDYYTTYTAKGTAKADPVRGLISDYALVAKDAKQKVNEAFETFAKNPSDENRAKLEEAMIHKYKASEAFDRIKPFHQRHEPFKLYKLEIKITPEKNSQTGSVHHDPKTKTNLSPFEVTAAARDVLRNAYSSRRDGEAGIKEIRAEAYKLYVNALSEEFKATGKIAYTNNTPSTPVHHHHNKQKDLDYFTKLKDNTFKSLQDIINREKGLKLASTSGTRKSAFNSHISSLEQWLKSGGKPQQDNYFIVSIKIIQPIKLTKASYGNFGHGQQFKLIDQRRDDNRRSHMASRHRDDDRRSHMVGRNGDDNRRSHMVGRNGDDDRRSDKVSNHRENNRGSHNVNRRNSEESSHKTYNRQGTRQ